MHVAFLITRSDAVGGASIHVRDMARNLNRRGFRATVLVGGAGGEVIQELVGAGVQFRILSCLERAIHPLKDLAAVAQITAALRQLQPDIVSTHTAKAGLLGRLACGVLGLPVLFTPHGWAISDRISSRGARLFRLAEQAAAPLASYIVNVCEAERSLARRHRIARDEKLLVIHNGVEDVPDRLRADAGGEPPRIVMVARFEQPKDHETLLRALAPLKEMAWTLELVGGGPQQREIRALSGSLGLDGRLHFHGSSQSVAERLAASQIFVLASRSEGFPRSILEAMRAGLPVVASDVGGVREAVADGSTGYVVPKSEPEALGAALKSLLSDAGLRRQFGAAARHRYENQFTFEQMFTKTLDIYRMLAPVRAAALVTRTGGA